MTMITTLVTRWTRIFKYMMVTMMKKMIMTITAMMMLTIVVTTNNLESEQLVVQVTVMMLRMMVAMTIMVMMIKTMMVTVMMMVMMINLKSKQLVDLLTNIVQVAVDPSQDVQLGKIFILARAEPKFSDSLSYIAQDNS